MTRYICICLLFVFFVFGTDARAQIPHEIAYQGILVHSDGTLLPDGNHTITIAIYSTAAGGPVLYTETQNVVVVKGLFNIMIGSVLPLPTTLLFDRAYFLGVAPDGSAELTPRTAMLPAPYALNSEHAIRADSASYALSAHQSSIATNSVSADSLVLPYLGTGTNTDKPVFSVYNTGNHGNAITGIGGGGSALGIMTASAVWGSGGPGYFGVTGFSDGGSDAYAGLFGRGGGSASGVLASSENGVGIFATSTNGMAANFKISNTSSISNTIEVSNAGGGSAIVATADHTGIAAIHGISADTARVGAGVFGETASIESGSLTSAATGVLGVVSSTAPGGYSTGVRGINNGTGGLGVGVVGYQAGSGWGVYGSTPKGYGVYGSVTDTAAYNTGVLGQTWSRNGAGVVASYAGPGAGIALGLSNGAIKVSGTNPAAFVDTATLANKSGSNATIIDNALCNGDANCIVLVTQYLGSLAVYNNSAIGVYYHPTLKKWVIFNENVAAIPVGALFNVWVIKR